MKLALDHHYPKSIASQLRDRGYDVVAVAELGWHDQPDERLLELCVSQQRALLTNNVPDFVIIDRDWQMQGRMHYGLIYTDDRSLPRTRKMIGRYLNLIEEFLQANKGKADLESQTYWLG